MIKLKGLVVASGTSLPRTVSVPRLLGKNRTEAVKSLGDLGLTAEVEEIEIHGTRDTVYNQNPMPFAIRAQGTVVTLQVIKAPGGVLIPSEPDNQFDNLGNAVAALSTLVGAVETEAEAATRHRTLLSAVETEAETATGRHHEIQDSLRKVHESLIEITTILNLPGSVT
ncbi:MAG: PASTA domain-containing protein [Pseudonocardiaceae bacterium]